ncbi:endonuclease III domain-containing protein [Campylobacter sp. MG1]|uniref:8-oxoguanine DNA glycosylase n=1 Tax=Campylobacter sp. MG1 TaxID=2976332 RepID=UPI00226CAC8A|nr:endonuclease III domain-containing protein [Campylobacter sp. MG1]
MINGGVILRLLIKNGYECEFEWDKDSNLSDFEKLISVILTQNTKWQNVLKSLALLKDKKITNLNELIKLDVSNLAILIKPSGFYNTKAKRILDLAKKILLDYENLDNFFNNVDREWLLACKGISYESADSILNYLCKKEYLVIDSYTLRFMSNLGYEFNYYDEVAEKLMSGLDDEYFYKYFKCNELYEIYSKFHSMLLNFCKVHFKGKKIDEKGMEILKELL